MPFTLLIGYDGSECSDAAIYELRRAGLPPEGLALVTTVADVWPHLPEESFRQLPPEELSRLSPMARRAHLLASTAIHEARQTAQQGVLRASEVLSGWTVRAEVGGGSPPDVLLKKAADASADLIHVGSRGRGAVEPALLGSTSHKVLAYARRSVRIARGAGCEAPSKGGVLRGGAVKLIVGVDGSAGSAAAVQAVAERHWPAGSQARVVCAIDTRIAAVPTSELERAGWTINWADVAEPQPRHWMQQVAEAAAARLTSAGLAVEPRVLEADPKRVLVSEATEWEADCIFVGARGLSRLERFLIGSVASGVVWRAPCSVEVVRKPAITP